MKKKKNLLYLYKNIEKEKLKEIIKLIEESESEENMSTIVERLRDEYINERKVGIAQGITQGIAQTIEKMIKMNLKDEFIKEVTGADDKEINRIRKSVMKNNINN